MRLHFQSGLVPFETNWKNFGETLASDLCCLEPDPELRTVAELEMLHRVRNADVAGFLLVSQSSEVFKNLT